MSEPEITEAMIADAKNEVRAMSALTRPAVGDELITRIGQILADDPICGGRVCQGTVEAIAGLVSPAVGVVERIMLAIGAEPIAKLGTGNAVEGLVFSYGQVERGLIATLSSTNGDDGELIAALNRKHHVYSGASNIEGDGIKLEPEIVLVNPDGPRAANRITSLTTEIAAVKEQLERMMDDSHFLLSVIDSCDEAGAPSSEMEPEDVFNIARIRAALNQDNGQ